MILEAKLAVPPDAWEVIPSTKLTAPAVAFVGHHIAGWAARDSCTPLMTILVPAAGKLHRIHSRAKEFPIVSVTGGIQSKKTFVVTQRPEASSRTQSPMDIAAPQEGITTLILQ
jgi:hypothetical protein